MQRNVTEILGNLLCTAHFSLHHNTAMYQLTIYLVLVVFEYFRRRMNFDHRLCYDVTSDISILNTRFEYDNLKTLKCLSDLYNDTNINICNNYASFATVFVSEETDSVYRIE